MSCYQVSSFSIEGFDKKFINGDTINGYRSEEVDSLWAMLRREWDSSVANFGTHEGDIYDLLLKIPLKYLVWEVIVVFVGWHILKRYHLEKEKSSRSYVSQISFFKIKFDKISISLWDQVGI